MSNARHQEKIKLFASHSCPGAEAGPRDSRPSRPSPPSPPTPHTPQAALRCTPRHSTGQVHAGEQRGRDYIACY
ncbi:hypothetical protein E2C01_010225 [Portunus trituberculatus]|uniref:Uncharacterized protein n=1 Tax=Portunus trituberculatus TaxID=210409 RepID=A0A5B7D7X5_PORTR|nr:hypothetical protein [Portunus trituberculatus]